jgi:serine/threonine protein kinase
MVAIEGKSLGHYQILSQVDVGGMAIIYKAMDTHLERNVAIKIIRKEIFSPNVLEQVLKRFEREAKSLAQLSHPNIVKVIDYGEFDGAPYFVMELLTGGNLKQRLQAGLNPSEAVRWLIPISHALAYAHHRGVIHRDVKPSNIMFTETNEPMLMDFGIAKILETHSGDSLTGSGVGIGTPEYMAPEQCLGQTVDARTDIYALGIVLYEILTGRRPFQADTPMFIVIKHVNEPPPSPKQFNPSISDYAEGVINKALAKNPDDRYPDMATFASELSILAGQSSASPGSTPVNIPGPLAPATEHPYDGKTSISEEDTGKLLIRINRLEKVVEESLAAEDFDDAENLISNIEGLGERGQQSAARLRLTLEETRNKARQRDADISNIRLTFPKALEDEDLPKAEEMLLKLKNLGPKGVALANQFQIAIETTRQQIALRQAEVARLTTLAEQNIADGDFSQAEGFILSLSVIGAQGKAKAASLQKALEKARQQAGRRKEQVFRLSGLIEQQISEKDWKAARKYLKELEKTGPDGKASAEDLGENLKRAEQENTFQVPVPVGLQVEPTEMASPGSLSSQSASIDQAPGILGSLSLRWIILGVLLLIVVIIVGGGLVIGLLNGKTPLAMLGISRTATPDLQSTIEKQAADLSATQTALSVTPTQSLALVVQDTPQPTATRRSTATITFTALPTLTETPVRYEVSVSSDYANIRSGPGTVYGVVASKPRDTALIAIGRNEAGNWLVIQLDPDTIGWISNVTIMTDYDPMLLPVVDAPPTPVIPTKKPTEKKSGGSSGSSSQATWTPPPP